MSLNSQETNRPEDLADQSQAHSPDASVQKPKGRWRTALVLTLLLGVLIGFSGWWIQRYIYAPEFVPTQLDRSEQEVLNEKLQKLKTAAQEMEKRGNEPNQDAPARLEPSPYVESNANRTICLTEKEINALIANQPEISQRLAIDLSEDLISINMLVPVDKDILLLGGKTLRFHAGLSVRFENGKPEVAIQGVSLGGIPIPNAWLGNLKYKNLAAEFGAQKGFWKLFEEGVADIKVSRDDIRIRLKP